VKTTDILIGVGVAVVVVVLFKKFLAPPEPREPSTADKAAGLVNGAKDLINAVGGLFGRQQVSSPSTSTDASTTAATQVGRLDINEREPFAYRDPSFRSGFALDG